MIIARVCVKDLSVVLYHSYKDAADSIGMCPRRFSREYNDELITRFKELWHENFKFVEPVNQPRKRNQ
jgi:hypothetical protein